jgi:hypothetical protein
VVTPVELRLRSRISQAELDEKVGKIITPGDFNVLLTGPALVLKPNGKPLCVYLPGAVTGEVTPEVYEVLHSLRKEITMNRGLASGSLRVQRGKQDRTYSKPVPSTIVGAIDPGGVYKYCRLTAWTGENLPQWRTLHPLLRTVAARLEQYVPDRYANQLAAAQASRPEWVVPGTPFSTVTVNNSYPTGVHTDKGDLEEGFSTIACVRRGNYTGGVLAFPAYRVGVDLHDGDLILMDAHEFHGNTAMVCECGNTLRTCCDTCGAERISVVSYFRTRVQNCGSFEDEISRARARREKIETPSDL